MENKLFIYGTLINPEIQKEVFGRKIKGVSGVLKGYKKSEIEIKNQTYPIIIPNNSSAIRGLVIEVTEDEFKKIDKYETNAYQRKAVVLESGIHVLVYVRGI